MESNKKISAEVLKKFKTFAKLHSKFNDLMVNLEELIEKDLGLEECSLSTIFVGDVLEWFKECDNGKLLKSKVKLEKALIELAEEHLAAQEKV